LLLLLALFWSTTFGKAFLHSTNASRKDSTTMESAATPPFDADGEQSAVDVATLAVAMQHRHSMLVHEQEALEEAQQELERLRAAHEEEQKHSLKVRREYLQNMVQLHSVELEHCNSQEQATDMHSKIEEFTEKKDSILFEIEQQKADWDNLVESLLAKHKVDQQLYEKNLVGAIQGYEKAKADRQHKLQTAVEKTEKMMKEREEVLEQKAQVLSDMEQMKTDEDEVNKQVENLAAQVRMSVAKVRNAAHLWTPFVLEARLTMQKSSSTNLHLTILPREPSFASRCVRRSKPTKKHTVKSTSWSVNTTSVPS
jgi:chromosome segregation ATPase